MANTAHCNKKHDSLVNVAFNVNSHRDCCSTKLITHHVHQHINDKCKCEQAKDNCSCVKKDDHKTESKIKDVQLKAKSVVLEIGVCCDGHTKTIEKLVNKFKGVYTSTIDAKKGLITVTGTMDIKALQKKLKEDLKKATAIASPEKKSSSGGNCVEKASSNIAHNKMECYFYCNNYGYIDWERQYLPSAPPVQYFSEENPNACIIA